MPLWALCSLCAVGCATHPSAPIEQPTPRALPDRPVPSNEPRATLGLVVDLKPGPKCEEEFDLALYSNRAIDLIQWDGRHGSCHARRIRVRYLSNRIDEPGLVAADSLYCSPVGDVMSNMWILR